MQFQESELTPGASPRHMYGAEIRRQRKLLDMTPAALGDILGYSRAQISRFETAERSIPPDLPAKLDVAFGTNGSFVALYELIKDDVFPDYGRRHMTFESSAVRIRKYVSATIPGLLQTRNYALSALRQGLMGSTDEEVMEAVDARMGRQTILTRDTPPHLLVVLDEAVLRRPVGGHRIMAEQLRHLLTLGESPQLLLQIVPFSHGAHPAMGGSLTLLTMQDGSQVAYLEGSHVGQLVEGVSAVARYELTYDLLRASALPQDASAAMIRAALEEYEQWTPPST